MTDNEFAHWLLDGDAASEEKIRACLDVLDRRNDRIERVGKCACHLLYRAIEGRFHDRRLVAMVGRAVDMAEHSTSESRLQKSRWFGSISIALAYYLILAEQNMDDAIVALDEMLDMRAVDDHPQNVLNIQRASMLLAAIHISRKEIEAANRAIVFGANAFRRAASLVRLDRPWIGLMDEMRRWVNALGVGVSLSGCIGNEVIDSPFVFDAFCFEPQEPFRRALRKILLEQSHPSTPINRRGLAAMFNGHAVELGVARGDFSRMILQNGECRRLWSVDRWSDHHDLAEYHKAASMLIGIRPGVCIPLRMTFDEALPLFADSSLDAIYIDGYAGGGQENGETLRMWWPKVKRGGLFAGHDYDSQFPATIKAVDAFSSATGFKFEVTEETEGCASWYGRKA